MATRQIQSRGVFTLPVHVACSVGTLRLNERATLSARRELRAPGRPSGPMKVTTVVPWDAASAVFTSDTELGIHRVDRWTLTDGGGKLRIERTVSNNEQELTARLVLVRQ